MKYTATLLLLTIIINIKAQELKKISGYVKDSASNESLIGATILNVVDKNGTVTNNYGYFCLVIPAKANSLQISYVGYQPKTVIYSGKSDTLINVLLSANNNLKEVVVYGRANDRLNSAQTSMELVSAKTIKTLPVIMGESDLTRTLLLLPGVSLGTENTCGYFVRGGSNDQNLLLIDGVPVYNAYHLYGFFSVFNTDAINQAKFYKGGMPARYGGRLSSVLDLHMKEGNAQKYSGEITLGMVSSKFLLEGPIRKGKTSFLITGRRSMMDLFPKTFNSSVQRLIGLDKTKREISLPDYFFYDLNAKVNHTFSNRSRLFLSFYNGTDDYMSDSPVLSVKNSLKWGNTTASVRWNYLFSKSLFGNFTIYYSKYAYIADNEDFLVSSGGEQSIGYSRKFTSGIEDFSAKADFDYNISNHAFKFGGQYIDQVVKPGVNSFFQSTSIPGQNMDTTYNFNRKTKTAILFIEDNFKIFKKLSLDAGLHFATFYTGSRAYPSLQPRLSFNYRAHENMAVKASYARMVQNLHLLSSSVLGGPSDIWVPATEKVKPAYSNEYVLGISYNVKNLFTITTEVYQRYMHRLIMYKEGANYMVDKNNWQDKVEAGTGNTKGLEFSLQKETGKTTGWISYTLSKSMRKFGNINLGREFPYTFDRRHNISIALIHKIGKFSIGADWVYATGHAVTVANTFVSVLGGALKYFESLNGFRMPPYHRLDLGITYQSYLTKKIRYSVSIGAYNLYNRANPYNLIDTPERLAVQSLFPILPYINISAKF